MENLVQRTRLAPLKIVLNLGQVSPEKVEEWLEASAPLLRTLDRQETLGLSSELRFLNVIFTPLVKATSLRSLTFTSLLTGDKGPYSFGPQFSVHNLASLRVSRVCTTNFPQFVAPLLTTLELLHVELGSGYLCATSNNSLKIHTLTCIKCDSYAKGDYGSFPFLELVTVTYRNAEKIWPDHDMAVLNKITHGAPLPCRMIVDWGGHILVRRPCRRSSVGPVDD